MMRTRYNKKRNTAFVYEVLIREGTSAILQKDDQRKNAIVKIIKKHFSTRSLLYKDLECSVSPRKTELVRGQMFKSCERSTHAKEND